MTAESDKAKVTDPGLFVLVALLRFNGIGADPEQLRHRCGTATIGIPEMLRCSKELGLKSRARMSSWARLKTTPLPAIAALKNGGYLLLGKIGDDKIIVQSPTATRPILMTQAEVERS